MTCKEFMMFINLQEWKMLFEPSGDIISDFFLNLAYVNLLLAAVSGFLACLCRKKENWCKVFVVFSALFTSLTITGIVFRLSVEIGIIPV